MSRTGLVGTSEDPAAIRWLSDGGSGRLVGVDIARGLAILGMLWVHFAPDGTGYALPDGRSAILFATLAGVSLGLSTGGAHPPRGRDRRADYRAVAIRGIALIVLGRVLVLLGTPIAVILDYYGVLFLLLLAALFAPRWVLGGLSLLAVAVGAPLIQLAGPDPAAAFGSGDPVAWPGQWLLTGIYPVALYAGYVAVGLIAARSDLSTPSTQWTMLVGGSVLATTGYLVGGALGVDAGPHANTTWEAVGSGGVAIATIGLMQLLSRVGQIRGILSPLADIGAMPLTIYTGQVVAAAVFLLSQPADLKYVIGYWWLLAALVGGSLFFAVVWRRSIGRGPLEQLLAVLSRPAAARVPAAGSAAGVEPVTERSSGGASPPSLPDRRVVGVALVAAVTGAAAVFGASALLSPAPTPDLAAGGGPPVTIAQTVGITAVDVDPDGLRSGGWTPDATGRGRATGLQIILPITAGEISAEAVVSGAIVLDGSGVSLTRGADVIGFSDLLVDFDAGTAAGDLSVNGVPIAQDLLLFDVSPKAPPRTATDSDGVTVAGLRMALVPAAAALVDGELDSGPAGLADLSATASVVIDR